MFCPKCSQPHDSPARAAALPPAQSLRVEDLTRRLPETGEPVAPPSVADGTTRKLGDL